MEILGLKKVTLDTKIYFCGLSRGLETEEEESKNKGILDKI